MRESRKTPFDTTKKSLMSCRGGIQKKLNKINEQSIQHSKIAQFIKQNIVQLNAI